MCVCQSYKYGEGSCSSRVSRKGGEGGGGGGAIHKYDAMSRMSRVFLFHYFPPWGCMIIKWNSPMHVDDGILHNTPGLEKNKKHRLKTFTFFKPQ